MPNRPEKIALPVSLIYGLVAVAWILLSDHAVALLAPEAAQITNFQTFKGLAFVMTTAVLLYLALRRQLRIWQAEQVKRQTAEAARFISDQKLRAIFDLSIEFIGLLRPDGTLVEANGSALDFADVKAAAVLGKPFWETPWWNHSKEVQERLRTALRRAAAGEFVRMEVTHRAPDGRLSHMDYSLKPIRDEAGQIIWLISEGRDITERKLAEHALRESESRFRQLTESLPQLVWTCTPDGSCDFLSEQWTKFTGVPAQEQLGSGWLNQVHPEDRGALTTAWAASVAAQAAFRAEYRIRRHDGGYRWFDGRALPLRGPNGSTARWMGSCTDIHDQRELREVVKASESKLRAVFDAEPDCLKLLEPDGVASEINAAGLRMIEADDAGQVQGKSLIPLVLTEDRDAVLRTLATAARGERGVVEFRIKGLKGTRRWLEMHVAPFKDPHAKRPLILGVSRDITERKQTEEALRLSKERLRACIDNTPNVAVQWYDDQGRVIFWNHASETLFGWRTEDALGKTLDQLTMTPKQATEFLATLQIIKRDGLTVGPLEAEYQRRDGSRGTCLATVFAIPFDARTSCYVRMDVDVTEHSRSREQVGRSVSLLQATLEATADGILVVDSQGQIASYNRKFSELWRIPAAVLQSGEDQRALECAAVQLTDPETFLEEVRDIYLHPETPSFDVLTFKDGRTFERQSQPQRLGEHVVGRVWSFRDVTERKRAERLVVQSELRLRLVWENALVAMLLTDADGTVLLVNAAYCQIVGKARPELEGHSFAIAFPEKARPQATTDYAVRFERREESVQRQAEVTYWNGRRAQLEVSDVFLELAGQAPLLLTIVHDITTRTRAERRSQVFAQTARELSIAISRRAAAEIIVDAAQQLLGWDACFFYVYEAEAKAQLFENILLRDTIAGRITDVPPPEGYQNPSAIALEVIQRGPKLILRDSLVPEMIKSPAFGDTARRSASLMYVPVSEAGKPVGILSIQSYTPHAYDESSLAALSSLAEHCAGALARIRVEEFLQKRERQFRSFIENASDLITVVNSDGRIGFQSPSAQRLLGYRPEELTGRNLIELIHADDVPATRAALATALTELDTPTTVEYRLRHRDGSWRRIQSIGRGTREHVPAGEIIFNSRDVTDSRALEEQYRQAQKMEAIGQLAGGVAHDFNNLLGVIQMQVELLKLESGLSPEQLDSTAEIGKAATRAANLTRQLLMFSRRQALKPRDLDLNEIVANLAKMLQRLLGEDVRIQFNCTSDALVIHADSVMIDQILLNLAVNARDAMPRGGRLIIETARTEFDAISATQLTEARPGVFACLSVSDTGTGIAPEILPHIFEPFFTTKDVGKGTGLGLATVFGLVQQHQGWINVYSEAGVGTSFRIYLPLLASPQSEPVQEVTLATASRGTETILVVEDETSLRTLVRTVLSRLGYQVLEAATGVAALEVWKARRQEIKLLLTDLVMPDGVNGRELAQRLKEEAPGLKVIYTSGYSQEIAGDDFPLREGENFLAKPFHATMLARVVRERLDA